MEKDIVAHVEQMERSHQELRELLMKNQEQHRDQMARMMDVIAKISRGKGFIDDFGPVNRIIGLKMFMEGLIYSTCSIIGHPSPKIGMLPCLALLMVNTF